MGKLLNLILLLSLINVLNADMLSDKIKMLVPSNVYKNNENFIKKIFSNKASFYTNNNLNIEKVVKTLKANGLIPLKLNKPRDITISFNINAFSDKNPSFAFLSYATSSLLTNMGYSYFYTTKATRDSNRILIAYTLNSESNIDPAMIIDNLSKRGYIVLDINKQGDTNWAYDISLKNTFLVNADMLQQGNKELTKINGKYWLVASSTGTLNISTKEKVNWYPKILTFDSNMNVIDFVMSKNLNNNYTIKVTKEIKYIMITDNYNATTLRNGIVLNFK